MTHSERKLYKDNTRNKGVMDITGFSMRLLIVLLFGHTELGEFSITHNPMLHFYTPWKRVKGFLTLWGGIEMEYWAKMGENKTSQKGRIRFFCNK